MPDDLMIADEQPHTRRAGAWIVLVMGLVGLGLGLFQWRSSLKAAFVTNAGTFKTPAQVESERIAAMKTKDTDGDTLNDYDETYVYKTSPYLDDSDSDGVTDQVEIAAGDDPNCPKGKDCSVSSSTGLALTPSASASLQIQGDVAQQLLEPTPAQLRELLVQNGAKQSDVDQIDDATLLQLYQESLTEVQQESATTSQ